MSTGAKAGPTVLSRWRIIYRPLPASNTNVCLNCPQARKIKEARLMTGYFAVLTRIGVPVNIRSVLRLP